METRNWSYKKLEKTKCRVKKMRRILLYQQQLFFFTRLSVHCLATQAQSLIELFMYFSEYCFFVCFLTSALQGKQNYGFNPRYGHRSIDIVVRLWFFKREKKKICRRSIFLFLYAFPNELFDLNVSVCSSDSFAFKLILSNDFPLTL